MFCKHHLPFESKCSDCLNEALQREQVRSAHRSGVERRARPEAKPQAVGVADARLLRQSLAG